MDPEGGAGQFQVTVLASLRAVTSELQTMKAMMQQLQTEVRELRQENAALTNALTQGSGCLTPAFRGVQRGGVDGPAIFTHNSMGSTKTTGSSVLTTVETKRKLDQDKDIVKAPSIARLRDGNDRVQTASDINTFPTMDAVVEAPQSGRSDVETGANSRYNILANNNLLPCAGGVTVAPHTSVTTACTDPVHVSTIPSQRVFTSVDYFVTLHTSRSNGVCVVPTLALLALSHQRDNYVKVYKMPASDARDVTALECVATIGGENNRDGTLALRGPRKLCAGGRTDASGALLPSLLIADHGNDRVVEVGLPGGELLRVLNIAGPHGLALDVSADVLAVSQPPQGTITLYHYSTLQSSRVIDCGAVGPSGIVLDTRHDRLYYCATSIGTVCDASLSTGSILGTVADYLYNFREPRDLTWNGGPESRELIVADSGNDRCVRVPIGGKRAAGTLIYGIFKAPASLCQDGDGRLFVCHAGARKLSILTPVPS